MRLDIVNADISAVTDEINSLYYRIYFLDEQLEKLVDERDELEEDE